MENSSSIDRLIKALREASEEVEREAKDRLSLVEIFEKAIELSLKDISKGCNPDEFNQLTVVNFTALASREGHEIHTIRNFVRSLNS